MRSAQGAALGSNLGPNQCRQGQTALPFQPHRLVAADGGQHELGHHGAAWGGHCGGSRKEGGVLAGGHGLGGLSDAGVLLGRRSSNMRHGMLLPLLAKCVQKTKVGGRKLCCYGRPKAWPLPAVDCRCRGQAEPKPAESPGPLGAAPGCCPDACGKPRKACWVPPLAAALFSHLKATPGEMMPQATSAARNTARPSADLRVPRKMSMWLRSRLITMAVASCTCGAAACAGRAGRRRCLVAEGAAIGFARLRFCGRSAGAGRCVGLGPGSGMPLARSLRLTQKEGCELPVAILSSSPERSHKPGSHPVHWRRQRDTPRCWPQCCWPTVTVAQQGPPLPPCTHLRQPGRRPAQRALLQNQRPPHCLVPRVQNKLALVAGEGAHGEQELRGGGGEGRRGSGQKGGRDPSGREGLGGGCVQWGSQLRKEREGGEGAGAVG